MRAEIDTRGFLGRMPLYLAVNQGNVEAVKALDGIKSRKGKTSVDRAKELKLTKILQIFNQP